MIRTRHGRFDRNAPERGTALLMAMIIVMLATGAAVAMASRQQLELRRLENTRLYDQALLHVTGIELWARGAVSDIAFHNRFVSGSMLAAATFNADVDGGKVAAQLVDLSGRFNLNNLIADGEVSAIDLKRFERLLNILDLDPSIATALLDWLDPDVSPRPGGAEDDYYSKLDPPYRAANQYLANLEELRLVRGITPEVYRRLAAVVTVLPGHTDLDVNTAPPEVIRSLADGLSAQTVEAIAERQAAGGFENVHAFLNMMPPAGSPVDPGGLAVSSNFFGVRGRVTLGRVRLFVDSVLNVGPGMPARLLSRRLSEVDGG